MAIYAGRGSKGGRRHASTPAGFKVLTAPASEETAAKSASTSAPAKGAASARASVRASAED